MIFGWGNLSWIGYALIGPPVGHSWHLLPATYCLVLVALLGWGSLLERWTGGRRIAITGLVAIAIAFAALVPWSRWELRRLTSADQYLSIRAYAETADWILEHQLDDRLLFLREPGYLAYLTQNPVIDGAGLVTKGVSYHGPKERRSTLAALLQEFEPDLVLLDEVEGMLPPNTGYRLVHSAQLAQTAQIDLCRVQAKGACLLLGIGLTGLAPPTLGEA